MEIKNLYSDKFYDFGGLKYLFVSHNINKINFYRTFLRYQELKNNQRVRISINNAVINKKNQFYEDYKQTSLLSYDEIKHSDVIVMQPSIYDIKNSVDKLKEINPNILILVDIYENYFKLKPRNYLYKNIDFSKATKIFNNIKYADGYITTSEQTDNYIKKWLLKNNIKDKHSKILKPIITKTFYDYSKSIKINDKLLEINDKNSFKILLFEEFDNISDFSYHKKLIEDVMKIHPNVDFYSYGTYHSFRNVRPLSDIGVKLIPRIHLKYDLATLMKLDFDLAILPYSEKNEDEANLNDIDILLCLLSDIPVFSYNFNIFDKYSEIIGFTHLAKNKRARKELFNLITEYILTTNNKPKIKFDNKEKFLLTQNELENELYEIRKI